MVLACESIFSRTSLIARQQLLKSNPEIHTAYLPSGASKIVFTCPSPIIYKFYLPGASTNVEPCPDKLLLC